MYILHLALGGCLKSPPIRYGLTSDTGGHIAYVLGAAMAQCTRADVARVTIMTRAFDDAVLGADYGAAREQVGEKLDIVRLRGASPDYLEKEALAADLPALTAAFLDRLADPADRPDVIHAHFADAAAMALAARDRFGVPFVYTPHALGIDKQGAGPVPLALGRRIAAEHAAIAAADAILVSTRDEAERQIAGYRVPVTDRVHVVAPGTPPCGAAPMRSSPAILDAWLDDPAKPILLAIARPVEKKNLVALVDAYRANPALVERTNLVILAGQHAAGRCSVEEAGVVAALRVLAADPLLRGRFALPGLHDAADIAALYAKAADGGVFVNPALHEPFGLTLIEAAAAGVPVVATCHGGPADIIAATGHGLLVDPRDIGAIGDACLAIVGDPALHRRFASAGRIGSALYSWDRYAGRSIAIYEELRAPAPRMLACDIDGTLTGCVAGAAAFAHWQATSALPFVIATGRSLSEARAVLRAWALPEPALFVTDVGTRIYRRAEGQWQACADYAAYLDDGWDRAAVLRHLDRLALMPQPEDTAGPHKISYFGTADDAASIRTALHDAGVPARVIFSHGRFIDVLAPRAGKAAALAFHAQERGWALRQVIACGDSGNDRDMLEAAGHAILVGNADEDLADMPAGHGLIRARAHAAGGIMEGLEAIGIVMSTVRVAA